MSLTPISIFSALLSASLLSLACASTPPPQPQQAAQAAALVALPVDLSPVTAMDIEWQASAVPIFRSDPSRGSAIAPVTIVEFGDLQCSFCARGNRVLKALHKRYSSDKLRFVWKNFPLPFHPRARPAQQAAAVVHALGGDFWRFHDLAYENQKALTEENFESWAQASGVAPKDFRAHRQSPQFARAVDEDIALGKKLKVTGTPQYFINGLLLDGAVPEAQFVALIESQLLAAKALSSQGVPDERLSFKLTADNFKPRSTPVQSPPDTRVWQVEVAEDDPVRGPQDALVTIVEWSDFQCPYCAQAQGVLEKVLAAYPQDVRIVWKDQPLPFHNNAIPAALLARFAFEQGGNQAFWPLHDALFANHRQLEEPTLQGLLEAQGLSWPAAQAAMKDMHFLPKLRASREQADDFGVRGTPHFFVNGQRLAGAQPFEAFQTLIDSRLAVARKAVTQGVARTDVYAHLMAKALPAPLPEQKVLPKAGAEHAFRGPANAPIVIQQFSDFQCPYCARVNPTLNRLMTSYPGQIRIVWRHLPLKFHEHAQLAAQAAQEAFAQKGNVGFWQYHDLLFAHQDALERTDLLHYAAELGLNESKFAKALDEHTHLALVQADIQIAQQAQIGGTPGFVINGSFLPGARPFHHFDKLIRRLLKKD